MSKWLIVLLVIVSMMALATYTGVTESFFVDDELSTEDSLGIQWGLITLTDGFDGSPWDLNWDENGTTDWTQNATTVYSAPNSAGHASGDTFLTSDKLDTSGAASINISFWFNLKTLNKGPLYVQIYNGSAYIELYDLTIYPSVVKNTWIEFSQTITEGLNISNFRIRFDGSTLTTDAFIDDVLIEKN